jgi:hypothetical protein
MQGHGSTKLTALSLSKGSPEETGGPTSGGIEDFRGAITQQMSPTIMNFSRFARVRQIRGSTDEATVAYTMTYVRIAEEGVRSRWRAIANRINPLLNER